VLLAQVQQRRQQVQGLVPQALVQQQQQVHPSHRLLVLLVRQCRVLQPGRLAAWVG
jgi:hypothetical protein